DWSPSSFPPDGHYLVKFDGTALYEYEETEHGEYPGQQNFNFNFGRREVANYLIANSLFWLNKFHIDGIRIDNVCTMLYRNSRDDQRRFNAGNEDIKAIEFIKHLNSVVHQYHPDAVMIAEESTNFYGTTETVEKGGLGFDFKWNLNWTKEVLSYFNSDPANRKYHHNKLTFPLLYAFTEKHILPLAHDMVVNDEKSLLNKMPGDQWQRFANLRSLYFYLWTHPGKKLLFMGGEIGQSSEWNFQSSLDWQLLEKEPFHLSLQYYVETLNKLYRENKPLWELDSNPEGFQWLNREDVDNSIITYSRFSRNKSDHLICLLNMRPLVHYDYKVGVPEKREYRELISTDMGEFGGSNIHNPEICKAIDKPFAEAPFHVKITIPPLAGVILQPEAEV
ncbi:MAG: alpha amylase C-terminal domain-containing protein, partial [Thermodesulfobacteriota bacterium]